MRSHVVWAAAFFTTALVASGANAQFSTDTCTADSVGLPCTYGTCIPGHCSSHDADGGSFDGPCVLCTSLPGPYCPAANVGQACDDGGVCLQEGMAGGGGSSGSSGGGSGSSYFSESFAPTWCGQPPSEDGGEASDGGVSSVSTSSGSSGGSGVGSGGVFIDSGVGDAAVSRSADAGSVLFTGSSSSSSGGGDNGSGSGSGGQGISPTNVDASGGDTKGGTPVNAGDAGASGTLTGSNGDHAAAITDDAGSGAADNGGGRETATGLACSMSIGRSGSSRLGFLALLGIGVIAWRRRTVS